MSPGLVLPTEIWSHIIQEIPKNDLQRLLIVSSLFHDIAIRSVFSSVKIYFMGIERGRIALNMTHNAMPWIEESARKLMSKSWEIMNHICREPRFAKVVKSLTVVACGDGLSIFERMTLANTLTFTPNLQTFRWIGVGPDFDGTVAEHLPSNLQKLVIQSSLPLDSLRHLNGLTSLHLSMPFFFPDDEEAHDSWTLDAELIDIHQPAIEVILEALSIPLTSLRITASQLRGVPIRVLNNLTELDIIATVGDEEDLVGLELVFYHATNLESLSLVGYFAGNLFSFFPQFSTTGALPRLSSFRISCDSVAYDGPEFQHVDALCEFLQNRPKLRRLFIRIPSFPWSYFYMCILSTIQTLPGLEVLGLHSGSEYLNDRRLSKLLQSLPRNLRALHLTILWDNAGLLLALVDAIGTLPHLTYLHIYGASGRLPLLLEDLATVAPGLQTIGLNRALWDIERVGSEIITDKWPRWKTKYCVEEDFLCEDDAWLFKYN